MDGGGGEGRQCGCKEGRLATHLRERILTWTEDWGRRSSDACQQELTGPAMLAPKAVIQTSAGVTRIDQAVEQDEWKGDELEGW